VSELAFDFTKMLREIDDFSAIAKPFLAERSDVIFTQYRQNLESIRRGKSDSMSPWSLPEDRPLVTRPSVGEYEVQPRCGELTVVAKISSKWEIRCPKEKGAKSVAQRHFNLCGTASTKVKLFSIDDTGTETCIGTWHADLGDAQSPGCHFHVQVLQDDEFIPFPPALSVPRFPAIFCTPLSVVEFVLGEMFQSDWQRRSTTHSPELASWSGIQKTSLGNLLDWQRQTVTDARFSPWSALKEVKPTSGMFVS